jgi:hypothetical protein
MRLFRSSGVVTAAVAVGTLATLLPLGLDAAAPAAADGGEPTSMTFDQLGSTLHFTVPAGVTTVHINAVGGSGGNGKDVCPSPGAPTACRKGGTGGHGGSVDMDVPVSPGEELQMVIGGAGTAASAGSGGAAGGLAGRDGSMYRNDAGSGNGGGATYVSRADGSMLAVGAGGGGGGGASGALEAPDGDGGDGGNGVDGRGYAGHDRYAGAGGVGSSGSNRGGNGESIVSDVSVGGGGGGGGGYQPNGTGGGAGGSAGYQVVAGGAGGGGAGGHSFSASSDAVIAAATGMGDGKVVISWTTPVVDTRPEPIGQITSSANPSYLGEPVTFSVDLELATPSTFSTLTIGTYDPTSGVELPQATWILQEQYALHANWTTVLPTGTTQIWASFSGDTFNKPWKSDYFTQLVGNARPRAVLALPSSSVDFGAQPVGTTSTKTVTIENNSAAPWHIASVAATEPAFHWTGGTCSSAATTPLAIGASCTIDLAFTPTSVPVVDGSLTLLDDVGTPTVLTMSGSGVAVPSGGPPPAPAAPSVRWISPSHGSKRGGTWVTIVGTNLVDVQAVLFGSRAATDVTCSATTCRVLSPKGSGTVHVRIVTPAGRSAVTRADRFHYTR